jgi:hypothetical protein
MTYYQCATAWTRTADGLGLTTRGTATDLYRTTYLVSIELGLKWEDAPLVYSSLV